METKHIGPGIVLLIIMVTMLYGLSKLESGKPSTLGGSITNQVNLLTKN